MNYDAQTYPLYRFALGADLVLDIKASGKSGHRKRRIRAVAFVHWPSGLCWLGTLGYMEDWLMPPNV